MRTAIEMGWFRKTEQKQNGAGESVSVVGWRGGGVRSDPELAKNVIAHVSQSMQSTAALTAYLDEALAVFEGRDEQWRIGAQGTHVILLLQDLCNLQQTYLQALSGVMDGVRELEGVEDAAAPGTPVGPSVGDGR